MLNQPAAINIAGMTTKLHGQHKAQSDSIAGRSLHQLTQWDGINRRENAERRTYGLRTLAHAFVSPRRFNGRRSSDRQFPILDRFESGVGFLAVGLMILSVMDSIFTLTLIAHGGTEVNPFMNWLLQINVALFVGVKMLLTGTSAVLLVAMCNVMLFKRFRARSILAGAVGIYCGLIVYELGLLSLL